jgi:hypothetical protein
VENLPRLVSIPLKPYISIDNESRFYSPTKESVERQVRQEFRNVFNFTDSNDAEGFITCVVSTFDDDRANFTAFSLRIELGIENDDISAILYTKSYFGIAAGNRYDRSSSINEGISDLSKFIIGKYNSVR